MGAKHKQKKGQANNQGPYKKFLEDLHEAMLLTFDDTRGINELSNQLKHDMYFFKYVFQSPHAYNEFVTQEDVMIINKRSHSFFIERNIEIKGNYLSNYQLHLLWCYIVVISHDEKRKKGADDYEVQRLNIIATEMSELFFSRYILDYFKVVTQLSRADHKYLSIKIRPTAILKTNPKIEIAIEVYGFRPQICQFNIEGHKRPAFRLAAPEADVTLEWISIDASLLGKHYRGSLSKLSLYIQSHALKRFSERLDVLNDHAINYLMWKNTYSIRKFEEYHGLLLYPVQLYDVKIGYLVCKVIDDKLLFSTFLFITHNSTPEGDRLKRLTGLGKDDISYWHIDRLSTFVNLHEDKYPQLMNLFEKAGMGDIRKLKDKKFDIDSLQDANLEALQDYILKNQINSFEM